MAHFAQLNEDNEVIQVLVVDNDKLLTDGIESEETGINFLRNLAIGDRWVQTSYNRKFRNKFAAIGDIYDSKNDRFVEKERPGNNYASQWQGIILPTNPSIIVDAAPRSGNRWLIEIIHEAFPDAFQRWGYIKPHNPKTFEECKNIFDMTITSVRNPIDSLASTLAIFGHADDEMISDYINNTIEMLESIKNNKFEITIFKFEEITQDVTTVLNRIGQELNVLPLEIDENAIKNRLSIGATHQFYSIPVSNSEILDEMREILSQSKFVSLMEKANTLYDEIIAI